MRPAGGSLTIREAVATDRAAMLDLWVGAWAAAHPAIDFAARRTWLDGHLDALRARGTTLMVAVLKGGEPAGFATVDLASGVLDQLVTAVSAQRRGVGRALLRHAKRRSPGRLLLSVNQFNTPAVRLYEAEGFRKIGEGVSSASGLLTWDMLWTDLTRHGAGPE